MNIAIVTGASSGMGKECAEILADRFSGISEIWLIARRKDRLEKLSDSLPVKTRLFSIDLGTEGAIHTLQAELKKTSPRVRFLVNAAGFGAIGKAGDISADLSASMIRVNCESLTRITETVLPYMPVNSRILNFASAAAFLPQPGFAVYAATKAYVLSYSRALRAELKKRKIAVTAVCPGPVRTEFFDIAEKTGVIPVYKKLVMADPGRVARTAVRDCMAGKSVSVYGITMKGFRLLCRVLPHEWLLKIWDIFPLKDADPSGPEAV
ncbi:MAG: SDR family NAD(P)-dependent oxidoreductase [Clostridium sp.]|nr:SDR family NAD(P)-dependent oxidoreductase [Clostridium sp.]